MKRNARPRISSDIYSLLQTTWEKHFFELKFSAFLDQIMLKGLHQIKIELLPGLSKNNQS